MRGFAAFLILTRHTEGYWNAPWLSHGHSYLAVDLFFALSGFVISHAYAQRLRDGSLSASRFMLIRTIRLWPLHALGAVLGAALLSNDSHPFRAVVWPLTLMLVFLPSRMAGAGDSLFGLNRAAWSLFYEMAVNLLYALTHRWMTNRVLATVIAVSGGALAAICFYSGGLDLGFTWSGRSIAGGALRAIFGISLGVGLHRLYLARWRRPRIGPGPWVLCAVAMAPLLMPRTESLEELFDLLAVFLVFPLCVYFGACASVRPRTVKLFSVLGLLSYPVYVLHTPLAQWLEDGLAAPLAGDVPLAGVLFTAGLALFAWWIDRWFDRPVRRFLTRLTGARKWPRPA
jgi:peptidoglycan/LPS O-acetylase OafA/YrhL